MAFSKEAPLDEEDKSPSISDFHEIPLTGQQKAGVELAKLLLYIIIGVLVVFTFFYFNTLDSSDKVCGTLNPTNVSDSIFNRKLEVFKEISLEKKEYREFIEKIFQYILGILIPVLTSILGYIFGTTRGRD
jgi:hypothetical protein